MKVTGPVGELPPVRLAVSFRLIPTVPVLVLGVVDRLGVSKTHRLSIASSEFDAPSVSVSVFDGIVLR